MLLFLDFFGSLIQYIVGIYFGWQLCRTHICCFIVRDQLFFKNVFEVTEVAAWPLVREGGSYVNGS